MTSVFIVEVPRNSILVPACFIQVVDHMRIPGSRFLTDDAPDGSDYDKAEKANLTTVPENRSVFTEDSQVCDVAGTKLQSYDVTSRHSRQCLFRIT